MRILRKEFFLLFILSHSAFAMTAVNPWYLSVNGGVFQANFNNQYNDLTDIIPQNIRETIRQDSYTGGVGIGYSQVVHDAYLLGAELSANLSGGRARFASGASSTVFTDRLYVRNAFDLVFEPGFILGEDIALYGKVGLSNAYVNVALNSPTGYTPTFAYTNNTKNVWGAASGLGLKKMVTPHVSLFSELNYHDYGTINFPTFQNFTATYQHTSHLTTTSVVIGASYYL